jgi:hypothetical protein
VNYEKVHFEIAHNTASWGIYDSWEAVLFGLARSHKKEEGNEKDNLFGWHSCFQPDDVCYSSCRLEEI